LENTTAFQVSDLKYLILDEADRLIDMGFEEQVSKIIGLLDQRAEMGDRNGKARQTVMLSATMHSGVSKLAKFSLHDPVSVGFDMNQSSLDRQGEDQMPKQLKQYYILVPTKLRPVILYKLVRKSFVAGNKRSSSSSKEGAKKCKMVIFVSCCDSVEFHYELLNELSACDDEGSIFNSEDTIFKLHGNMTQQERTKVYFDFCKSSCAILICTDVAARGLDFPLVTHIVQYDPPGEAEDYIHRVGRTARMESKGEAYLFLLPTEMPYIDILRDRGIQLQEDMLGQFLDEDSNLLLLKGKVNALFRDPVFQKFQRLIFDIVSDSEAIHQLAADAYRSFLRAYARYPSAIKTIFNVKVLHIGHVADSFGLREKPSMIGKSTTAQEFKKRKNEHAKSFVRKKKPKQIFLSE
jgi:ATP-dependent RNA helicase DDX31/DBP7